MTTMLKTLAVALLLVGLAGCDTTAFTEDFPDPETAGLPPYVAFDVNQLTANSWAHSAELDAQGSRRTVTVAPTANPAQLLGLRVRLPRALEENVDVTFQVSGDAVYGEDYTLSVFDPDSGTAGAWVANAPTGNTGIVQIRYRIEDWPAANIAPHYRDLRITALPNPDRTTARTVTIDLVSAAAPSGRTITIGRLPSNRDNRATLTIN